MQTHRHFVGTAALEASSGNRTRDLTHGGRRKHPTQGALFR